MTSIVLIISQNLIVSHTKLQNFPKQLAWEERFYEILLELHFNINKIFEDI